MPWRALDVLAVLVSREGLRAERDTLIEANPVANDARLTDDDAGAVIDEELFADLRTRVNVDSSLRVGELRDESRDQRNAASEELVSYSMVILP